MSQFQNSLEFLLKIKAEGQQVLDQVSAQIDQFAAAQQKAGTANLSSVGATREASAATGELAEAQKQAAHAIGASNAETTLQRGALGTLAAQVRTAALAYVGLAGARRALALASEQDQAEQRLLGILRAQTATREEALGKQRELIDLTRRVARDAGVFAPGDLLGAENRLIAATGRSDLDFDRLLRVAADSAVALYDGNLERAVNTIAQSFAGQTGDLGRLLPELEALRREVNPREFRAQLREGLVVDLLERRFGGSAEAAADSPSGRGVALRNRLNDQLEALGGKILPAVNDGLEALTISVDAAASALSAANPFSPGAADGGPSYPSVYEGFLAAVKLAIDQTLPARDPLRAGRDRLGSAADALDSAQFRRGLDISSTVLDRVGAHELAEQLRALRDSNSDLLRLLAGAPTRRALPAPAAPPAPPPESLVDFDDDTRRGLIAQLGLVDTLNAALLETEDSFRRLGALDAFPIRLFDEDPLRESEAFFNLAKIGLTQEQLLRDLKRAQDDYAQSLAHANDLVEAGQISGAQRNEVLEAARAKLRAVIDGTEELADASEAEAKRSLEALQGLVDAQGDLVVDITLGDTTQLGDEVARALKGAKDRLDEDSKDLATLSAEVGERAFGPLVSELDDALKTGEVSVRGFAAAILDVFTRLASEAIVGQFLSGLLGGSAQAPGAGSPSGFGQFLNFFGGIFGFDAGGPVPGPDLGRDSRLIAVRGQEYVLRPEPLRVPGVLDHVAAINRGDLSSIDFARLGVRLPPTLRATAAREFASIPGYAGGGFVDAVATVSGASRSAADEVFGPARDSGGRAGGRGGGGGGGVTIVPVLPLDRRTIETINGARASRDTIARIAREATGASAGGAAGARGMPS